MAGVSGKAIEVVRVLLCCIIHVLCTPSGRNAEYVVGKL